MGEHKSLQTDRVILVPGPDDEAETVRWMYRQFIDEGKVESEIAALLNERGVSTDLGRPWTCLVSLDDEAFTYNRLVNRLATIQEHRMILKLVERGIPGERIAETLNVNVRHIRAMTSLLHGICPEAAELLKDKRCPIVTIQTLKKMKPPRQVEAIELMTAMGSHTIVYAKALLAATPPDQLVDAAARRTPKGASPEQIARMEREMANLQRGIKGVEATYGSDHLHLILAAGYVRSLC